MLGVMVMLYWLGFIGGFEVVQGFKVLLYEIFGDGVVVIVGVGFGEVVMVVFEVVVVLFLDVFVVDFFVVEFVVGDGVVEGGIGLGVGVGLEVLMVLDVGFFVGNVIGFV